MTEFKVGDKVRVNEGLLEGCTGYVTGVPVQDNVTLVELENVSFVRGDLAFYTDTLISAEEDHEAMAALRLHPELLKKDYLWKLTIFVGGIMYQSLPIDSQMVKRELLNPPAGLYAVDYVEKARVSGHNWRTLWAES